MDLYLFRYLLFVNVTTSDSVEFSSLWQPKPVLRLLGMAVLLLDHLCYAVFLPRHSSLYPQAQLVQAVSVQEV